MSILRGENKIAALLVSLPRSTAENLLSRLGQERGGRLRGVMDRVRSELSPDLIDEVLREFEELMQRATQPAVLPHPRLAVETVQAAEAYESVARIESDHGQNPNDPDAPASDGETVPEKSEESPVHDVVAELRLIDTGRLAGVLQGEHPRGVATVLSCLEPSKACETLMHLEPEVRRSVFPRLGQAHGGGDDISLRIVRAVVAKSRAMTADPGGASGDNKAQMMAEMLKSMERADRTDLMAALAEQDDALAAAVRERLYVFEDLLHLEGQTMQKLLAEIDSKTLAIAMQDASETIIDNVMINLSKRARESLSEEMNFLGTISQAQVQQARKSVVEVIQRMDEAEGAQ